MSIGAIMKKKDVGYVSKYRGLWVVRYKNHRVTYSESRFGELAEQLAIRALGRLRNGDFDPVYDDLIFKFSWTIQDAAVQLCMSVSQLRQWMLTGVLGTIEIKPPARDYKGNDRINGCELIMAVERVNIVTGERK